MPKKTWTFRSKVLLLVAATVLFTALTIQYSARHETERAMLTAYEENASNLMNTVVLNVENQYRSILFHKSATLERRKAGLRNIVTLALERIEKRHEQWKAKELSDEESQRLALEDVRGMRYDDGVGYLWINDMDPDTPRMIMHSALRELEGTTADDERYSLAIGLNKNSLDVFVAVCREHGEGYVDYLAVKPSEGELIENAHKVSYVKRFKPWEWVVGTGVYVDDVEAEVQRRLDAVIADLSHTLAKVRIAETGSLFIFDGDKRLLVHPTIDGSHDLEMRAGMLEELMEAAKTPTVPFEYAWSKPGGNNEYRFRKRAYVTHFEPLDWYIGASFFADEMELPARRLTSRIFLLSCLVLLVSIGFAVWISKVLMKPLQRLTLAAANIEREGILAAEIPISGSVETVELGAVLRKMLSSIEKSDEDLRRANNYIGNIIDSMPSVLVGVDAQGKVTQWNSAAERVTGLGRAQALGQPINQLLPVMASEMDRVLDAVRSRQAFAIHRRVCREGEQICFQNVTVYPLTGESADGAVIRVDDVTEQVRIEEMMVQSEKMLSVGGMAAGMAHEINNPLAGMVQTASVLSSRLTDDLPANTRAAEAAGTNMEAIRRFMESRGVPRMLARIRESGTRAAGIVWNMLSFARKTDSAFSTCNLAELLDQTVDLAGSDYDLKKKYDFRQIEIIRQYEEGVPEIPCEASRIQQVVLNLLRNGAEAMQEGFREGGGKEKPRFVLGLAYEREAERVRIEVEDNGPGMDETTRRRVFEPFFTTKPTDRGTGLGLSVSYFIVTDTHGGEMSVESSPGEGSKFIIRLPVGRGIS